MRRKLTVFVLLPSLLLSASMAIATDVQSPVTSTTLQPGGTIELHDLVVVTGRRLGKQFAIDPRVHGPISLDSLKPETLTYHALLELLEVNGFVAIPSGDIVAIMPDAGARTVATPVLTPETLSGDDAEVATVVIPIGALDPARLIATLRPLMPNWAYLYVTDDKRSVLLVDRVANARRIIAIIQTENRG